VDSIRVLVQIDVGTMNECVSGSVLVWREGNPNAFASLDAEGGLWEAVDNAPPFRSTA
jgi:hypothetical protein